MTVHARLFGHMPDGTPVPLVTLRRDDMAVEVISFGAALRDIRIAGRSVVLGCDTLEDYVAKSPHFGAIVGRCANRIAGGRLPIDGVVYDLTRNDNGRNTLHGGAPGFSRRNWSLLSHDAESVLLGIVAADGEQGFPGRVEATCRYELTGENTLEMVVEAVTDKTTAVTLANHSYFNLTGAETIDRHEVEIAADLFLPLDKAGIPTGEIADVEGTRYDFRTRHEVGEDRFDTPFVLRREPIAPLRHAASVKAGGLRLDVATTQPCVQFYTGGNIKPGVPKRGGGFYPAGAGLCFETQGFPDAPNHANFPSVILRPGERYRQVTTYRFATM